MQRQDSIGSQGSSASGMSAMSAARWASATHTATSYIQYCLIAVHCTADLHVLQLPEFMIVIHDAVPAVTYAKLPDWCCMRA